MFSANCCRHISYFFLFSFFFFWFCCSNFNRISLVDLMYAQILDVLNTKIIVRRFVSWSVSLFAFMEKLCMKRLMHAQIHTQKQQTHFAHPLMFWYFVCGWASLLYPQLEFIIKLLKNHCPFHGPSRSSIKKACICFA